MKLNIFRICKNNVAFMKEKFNKIGLNPIHSESQLDWDATFYFSQDEEPCQIPWVETYKNVFKSNNFKNHIYFGAYVFEKNDQCFVLSFGKTHFFIRPYCERNFGIEVAKRISNETDIRQIASKKFAGKKKKEIKSYISNSTLDIESGEAIEFLRSSITEEKQDLFGKSGKFGESIFITPYLGEKDIGDFFDKLLYVLNEEPKFKLPRTQVIKDVEDYDNKLINSIKTTETEVDFSDNTHDIAGVDFVFSGNESYTLQCRNYSSKKCENLSIYFLKKYISENSILDQDILKIKVKIENEGQKTYSKDLKQSLDFVIDDENIILVNGNWVHFNEDYIEQLNTYIDGVEIEETEEQFRDILAIEPAFNSSEGIRKAGYSVADKDFSKIKTHLPTPVEAWDLKKGDTVYAVKFGTAQKLSYVCAQALGVLEIIRNKANIEKIDNNIKSYCLWLGYEAEKRLSKISDSRSIILRQSIEVWARKCRELGIKPKLKISRKIHK